MKIIKLNATSSTNEYLNSLSKEVTLNDELIVTANTQTKGKGQAGAVWFSEPGRSLAFSAFKRYNEIGLEHQFAINWAVSLGVFNALKSMGFSNLNIKWPNDIMADGKKVGGILIENSLRKAQIVSSIIGVGLNVNNNNFPNLPRATSLYLCSGIEFDLDTTLEMLSGSIFTSLKRVKNTSNTPLLNEYNARLFRKDVISVFEDSLGNQFNGIIKRVKIDGKLEVETEEELKQFSLKEINLLY